MNIYIDLSVILLLMEIMVCVKMVESLTTHRIKRRMKLTLLLVNFVLFFSIYLSSLFSIILFLFFNYLVFKVYEKKIIITFLLYIFFYFSINFLLNYLVEDLTLKNSYLVVSTSYGFLYGLLIPVFGIWITLSTKIVDSLFHLHSFKTQCIVSVGEKKYLLTGYFDTGNTIKYDNVPVVFVIKNTIIIEKNKQIEFEVNTIQGRKKYLGYQGLLKYENLEEDYYVYIAETDSLNSFNGCEILLNAYLMR